MSYGSTDYPFAQALQMMVQKRQQDQAQKNAPLDNLVQALQTLASGYYNKKVSDAKSADEITRDTNKITAEGYVNGKLGFTRPAPGPLEPTGTMMGVPNPSAPPQVDKSGNPIPIGQPAPMMGPGGTIQQPYYPKIRELLTNGLPGANNGMPANVQTKPLEDPTRQLNAAKLEELKWTMGLKKELVNMGEPAFKQKYGDAVLQSIKALPAFNVMDLLGAFGYAGGGAPATGAGLNSGSNMIKIKRNGVSGSIPESEFNAQTDVRQ